MISASNTYKQSMADELRKESHMVATIGIINQAAQKGASISTEYGASYSYLSNLTRLLDNYDVEYDYATMEQDFFRADGTMLFAPRPEDAEYLFNQGAVTADIAGAVCITFGLPYDIRGLTIDFGTNYPVDFEISNGTKTAAYSGNDRSYWTTDEIFDGTEYLLITPSVMRGGQDRLRIRKILMGVGISFENKKIKTSTKTEFISPITEELSTVDFSMSIENYGRAWDVENETSAINYLEVGQEVTVRYGYEMPDGSVLWMDGCVCNLADWEADDETMSFTAKDKLDDLSEVYYRGQYRPEGITLYDLALDVFADAGLDERQYELDRYLRKITVYNPLPCVTHKECLQIIANAGRCKLYTDRKGVICIRAAFTTVISSDRMDVTSDSATAWSDLASIVGTEEKIEYATFSEDHFRADGGMYFLPRNEDYLVAGFVSEAVADSSGAFTKNPTFTITLEAAMKYYSLMLRFSSNPAQAMTIHTSYEGELQESYPVTGPFELENFIDHEFPMFDAITFEFTKGAPNSRVFVDSVEFLEVTDYLLDYHVMTKTPKGIRGEMVKRIDVFKEMYEPGTESKNLAQETVDVTGIGRYAFYFTEASHDISVTAAGAPIGILESSSYYVIVDVSALTGTVEIFVDGKTYSIRRRAVSKALNTIGTIEAWENPLISNDELAGLLADWIGNYFTNNVEYEISYRGEPRLDAGDIVFLENKYVEDLQIQIYSHRLNFSGGLSGTIKARRAVNQKNARGGTADGMAGA